MKHCSAIQSNQLPIHATAWVNLKIVMLSEGNHTRKTTYCMVQFIWNPEEKGKTVVTEADHWLLWLHVGKGIGAKEQEGDGNLYFSCGGYTTIYFHTPWKVHLKCVDFILCKWYLISANFKMDVLNFGFQRNMHKSNLRRHLKYEFKVQSFSKCILTISYV